MKIKKLFLVLGVILFSLVISGCTSVSYLKEGTYVSNNNIENVDFKKAKYIISKIDKERILDHLDKKKKIKGLSAARADVFPAALSAISAVVDYMQFNSVVTGGCGIREGVMFNHVVPLTLEKPISDIPGYSLHAMVHHLGINEQHAEQTFNLCVQLSLFFIYIITYLRPKRAG